VQCSKSVLEKIEVSEQQVRMALSRKEGLEQVQRQVVASMDAQTVGVEGWKKKKEDLKAIGTSKAVGRRIAAAQQRAMPLFVNVLLALAVIQRGAKGAPVGRSARAFLCGLDVLSRRMSNCGPVHTRRVCSHTRCKSRVGCETDRASEDALKQVRGVKNTHAKLRSRCCACLTRYRSCANTRGKPVETSSAACASHDAAPARAHGQVLRAWNLQRALEEGNVFRQTPLTVLSGPASGRVLLKREDVQYGFSFHVRGALNLLLVDFLAQHSLFQSARGVITTRADQKPCMRSLCVESESHTVKL
jgi:hypothetical protein